MKFALPILTADGREFADARALAELIGGETSGHYLLGNHQKWHGGMHISDASAPWCRDKYPVRAMADGKVVAFRMMEEYLVSEFQGQSLRYSNCFCLIEHAYCETNPDAQAQNAFTFYTLYMHLKPWQPDQDGEKLVLKKRWNVRNSVPHHHPDAEQQQADAQLPKVPLPARTELELVAGCEPEWGTVDGKDYRFIKVSIKSALPREVLAAGEQAGVLLNQGSQVWVADSEAALEQIIPPQPLWLFDQIEAELTGNMVGHADPQFNGPTGRLMMGGHNTPLPSGTLIEYDAHRLEFHWSGDQARKMARCHYRTPSQGGQTSRTGVAWVCVEESYIRIKRQTPSQLNKLYVLPSPIAIKAGETVGFLGLMETPATLLGGKQSKHQVHLELFTQDPRLDAVLANQAATVGSTRYARVPAGLALYAKRDNQWVDTGQQSEAALLTAPAEEKSGDTQWLCVKEGAYVRKEQVEMLSQHDWLKLGFKKVDGSGSDGYLDPQQAPAFFQELAHCLDTNQDGHLSSEEITAALCNLEPLLHSPQSRSRLQKLIVRHPSEWYDKSTGASHQWLDKLKAQVAQPEFDQLVAHEKQRIDQLEWMQSATSLKLNRELWHFWPLGMVPAKNNDCGCNRNLTLEELKSLKPARNITDEQLQKYLDAFNDSFAEFSVTTCVEKAHFLAQVFHESGSLYYTSEYRGERKNYAPWYGRGLLQITFEENYANYGHYVGEDVTSSASNRDKLTVAPHVVKSAFWYVYVGKPECQAAFQQDDFLYATYLINGGFTHYIDRRQKLELAANNFGGTPEFIKNRDGEYRFEDSHIYEQRKSALAWGIWNDVALNKTGHHDDKVQALKGYHRFIELLHQRPFTERELAVKWYGTYCRDWQPIVERRIYDLE